MDNDSSPLADTEVHYLRSEATDVEYKIFVGHCGPIAAGRIGVLYVTDANGLFGMTVDLIRSMQLSALVPPLLVVGIGYRVGILAETIGARTRDLSPTSDDAYAALFPQPPVMGGGPAFLQFIRSELMPWVGSRYEVDASDTAYFGHSLGGLFGAYVLLDAPTTFGRYLISSPSLYWDGGVAFALEEAYAGEHDDLGARVFFGIGADETQDGRAREAANLATEQRELATAWYIDMVADMGRLVDQLSGRGYPSLELTSAVMPGEFHITVPALNLTRGLRVLYDAPR